MLPKVIFTTILLLLASSVMAEQPSQVASNPCPTTRSDGWGTDPLPLVQSNGKTLAACGIKRQAQFRGKNIYLDVEVMTSDGKSLFHGDPLEYYAASKDTKNNLVLTQLAGSGENWISILEMTFACSPQECRLEKESCALDRKSLKVEPGVVAKARGKKIDQYVVEKLFSNSLTGHKKSQEMLLKLDRRSEVPLQLRAQIFQLQNLLKKVMAKNCLKTL